MESGTSDIQRAMRSYIRMKVRNNRRTREKKFTNAASGWSYGTICLEEGKNDQPTLHTPREAKTEALPSLIDIDKGDIPGCETLTTGRSDLSCYSTVGGRHPGD
jgi:hypothetical protein